MRHYVTRGVIAFHYFIARRATRCAGIRPLSLEEKYTMHAFAAASQKQIARAGRKAEEEEARKQLSCQAARMHYD